MVAVAAELLRLAAQHKVLVAAVVAAAAALVPHQVCFVMFYIFSICSFLYWRLFFFFFLGPPSGGFNAPPQSNGFGAPRKFFLYSTVRKKIYI